MKITTNLLSPQLCDKSQKTLFCLPKPTLPCTPHSHRRRCLLNTSHAGHWSHWSLFIHLLSLVIGLSSHKIPINTMNIRKLKAQPLIPVKEPDAQHNSDVEEAQHELSVSFLDTGLPPFLFINSYSQATKIVEQNLITKAPGREHTKTPSLWPARDENKDPYTPCHGFGCHHVPCAMHAHTSLCSHSLAVGNHCKLLPKLLSWYITAHKGPNLCQLVRETVPANTGKKPNARERKDGGTGRPGQAEPMPDTAGKRTFHFKRLDITRAYICYRCNKALRLKKGMPPAQGHIQHGFLVAQKCPSFPQAQVIPTTFCTRLDTKEHWSVATWLPASPSGTLQCSSGTTGLIVTCSTSSVVITAIPEPLHGPTLATATKCKLHGYSLQGWL